MKKIHSRHRYLFCSAMAAGVCIAIGGTAFLSVDNPVVGALLFGLGLLMVVTDERFLYTGQVHLLVEADGVSPLDLTIIYLGNVVGGAGVGLLERCTRFGEILGARATGIVTAKLTADACTLRTLVSPLILGILCNILITFAVKGYRRCGTMDSHHAGKYLVLMLPVMVFVLCGFEHCIADVYYISLASWWNWRCIPFLFLVTIGNTLGGMLMGWSLQGREGGR